MKHDEERGWNALKMSKYAQALKYFKTSYRRNPTITTKRGIILSYCGLGDSDTAMLWIKKLGRKTGSLCWLAYASLMFDKNDIESASRYQRKAGKTAMSYVLRSKILLKMGNPLEAAQEADDALNFTKSRRDEKICWMAKAEALAAVNKHAEACECLEKSR